MSASSDLVYDSERGSAICDTNVSTTAPRVFKEEDLSASISCISQCLLGLQLIPSAPISGLHQWDKLTNFLRCYLCPSPASRFVNLWIRCWKGGGLLTSRRAEGEQSFEREKRTNLWDVQEICINKTEQGYTWGIVYGGCEQKCTRYGKIFTRCKATKSKISIFPILCEGETLVLLAV